MTKDLAGVTLIDLGGMGPSARCVRVLADLGARWLRLRPPSRDDRLEVDWYAYGALRGAEEIVFDLKRPGASDFFLQLVRKADIVVEGFRPGVANRLGVGFAQVQAANPRIIYCSATGYGQTGTMANVAGHDLNYQALSGGLSLAGRDAEGLPAMPAMTIADSAGGGWQAALRVLAALVARSQTGAGQFLDVSAAEGVLHLLSVDIDRELAAGNGAGESVVHGYFACYGLYETADGRAVAVGAIEPRFFLNLCRVLGLESLVANQYDADAQPELHQAIAAAFRTRNWSEWAARFEGVDACVTPVLSFAEVRRHPHWRDRGVFIDYPHPKNGPTTQVGPMGGGSERGAPPDSGNSSFREVLASLGISTAEIEAAHAQGIVA